MINIVITILTGGKSKRMGYKKQKILLKNINLKKYLIIFFKKINLINVFLNIKKLKKNNSKFYIKDEFNSESPLIGLFSIIKYFLKESVFQITLILTNDMPLLTKKLIFTLITINNSYNGAYFINKQFPLKIKITKKNLILLKKIILKNKYQIKNVTTFIKLKKLNFIKKHYLIFSNINSPKKWFTINRLLY